MGANFCLVSSIQFTLHSLQPSTIYLCIVNNFQELNFRFCIQSLCLCLPSMQITALAGDLLNSSDGRMGLAIFDRLSATLATADQK